MSIFDGNGATATAERQDQTALISLIGERFISRKDVKAHEGRNGEWFLTTDTGKADGNRMPMSMQDFQDHLSGKKTLGHYMLGKDDTCKYFAFDLDLDKKGYYLPMTPDPDGLKDDMAWIESAVECSPREIWAAQQPPEAVEYFTMVLRCLAEGLAHMVTRMTGGEVPVAILDSGGKGMHVYGFTGQNPAGAVKDVALDVLKEFGFFEPIRGDIFWKSKTDLQYSSNVTIEVFPKQKSLDGKDLGNLMRLPLGVNQKTGRRSRFISCKSAYHKILEMDPMRALGGDFPWE